MREQIDILEGMSGDEAVHASTASHGDETPKKTTQDRIEIKFHRRGKGGGLRLYISSIRESPAPRMPSRISGWVGATSQAELKWMRVRGEKSVMAREFVSPMVGDSGWGEETKEGKKKSTLR